MDKEQEQKQDNDIGPADDEIENNALSIRSRKGESENNIKLEKFIEKLNDE